MKPGSVVQLLQQVIYVVLMLVSEGKVPLLVCPSQGNALQQVLESHQADKRMPFSRPAGQGKHRRVVES